MKLQLITDGILVCEKQLYYRPYKRNSSSTLNDYIRRKDAFVKNEVETLKSKHWTDIESSGEWEIRLIHESKLNKMVVVDMED